jgi:hypothetical protein
MESSAQGQTLSTVAKPKDEQPEEHYDVGILFVHGMGEQNQGDSVTEMGDALTEWLRKWLKNSKIGKPVFKVREAKLRSGGQVLEGTPDHPIGGQAHVSVTISDATKDNPLPPQQWLLAESWWATTFRQATFIELVAWAFSAGPWLIASQRAGLKNRFEAARRPDQGTLRIVLNVAAAFFLSLVAAVVASLVTPVFIALLVLSLVPIPGVTSVVKAIVKNLSGSFGDLLILVRSPVRFAAMAEQVRTDIADVCKRCDHVIVLAHSQGSAVSWHAIRRTAERRADLRSRIDLFVSFGQALRKLKSLYLVHTAPGRKRLVFFGLATLSTILLLFTGWQGAGIAGEIIEHKFDMGAAFAESGANPWWFAASLAAVLIVQEALVRMADRNDGKGENEIRKEIRAVQGAIDGFQWLDFWASADPAPNGPLMARLPKAVESYKIRNVGSTLLDHSVYWSNRTVFVSAVAFAAASLVGASPMGIQERIPAELREAAMVRGQRVTMLLAGRVLFLVALATTLFGTFTQQKLPVWGAAALKWINELPLLPDWFAGWTGVANGIVAAVLVGIIGLVVWWFTIKAWDVVIGTDEGAFFCRQPAVRWSAIAIAWMVGAVAVPTAVMVGLSAYLGEWWGVLGVYLVLSVIFVPLALIGLSQGGKTLDQAPGAEGA